MERFGDKIAPKGSESRGSGHSDPGGGRVFGLPIRKYSLPLFQPQFTGGRIQNPNDMKTRHILAATLLFTGGVAAAQPEVQPADRSAVQSAERPRVIAHRGYWTAPGSAQNSLTSFAKADSIGVYGSEFDVWFTANNKLIVNHDRIYKGTKINMEKSTAREIMQIVLPNGKENIPSLDDYLSLAASRPDTRLILEMKSLSDLKREDLAAAKIVKALRKHGVLDRTDIIAFSINACLAFRKLVPETRIYYLNGDLPPQSIKELGLAGIDYESTVLRARPEWVEQAHDLGLEVNVWTVDSEQEMRYFIDLGVDYITTNYPERLQALLRR